MAKIYDYLSFNDKKGAGIPGAYNFEDKLKYIDIDIFGKPEEYEELNDASLHLSYSVQLILKKSGIDMLIFTVTDMELEFEVDDYPNENKQFDVDLIPGKTIDFSQIKTEEGSTLIPTYPDKAEIDMKKSTNPRNWEITIHFGSNRGY